MRVNGRSGQGQPLHVRFRRIYQLGMVLAVVAWGLVWFANQRGLDGSLAASARARVATSIRQDVAEVGDALDGVEESPESPVAKSDLSRVAARLDRSWAGLVSDPTSMPADVELLINGPNGLAEQMTLLLSGAESVADVSATRALRMVASEAGRFEKLSAEISSRLGQVVASYEAQEEASVGDARRASNVAYASAIAISIVVAVAFLRPMERRLRDEHYELVDAGTSQDAERLRQELSAHLAEGLDAVESESETMTLVSRALAQVVDVPAEVLMSDTSRTNLTVAAAHPVFGGPGCGVSSPADCPAISRGRTLYYENSGAINACPQLQQHCDGPTSATCIPLSFMGKSMGVVHSTGPIDDEAAESNRDFLSMIASQSAVRIGTLRSFAQVELQTSTDILTGLPNRRATEDRVMRLNSAEKVGSVAMADLDYFKSLNDTYGHEAGDRALRLFADVARDAMRDDDWLGRWGGEEFVFVMPGMVASQAKAALDRMRARLAEECAKAEVPTVRVSIGVVDTESAETTNNLMRLADEALLAAKAQGRDRVLVGPVMAVVGSGASDDAEPTT